MKRLIIKAFILSFIKTLSKAIKVFIEAFSGL